jgi:hypothetical protein
MAAEQKQSARIQDGLAGLATIADGAEMQAYADLCGVINEITMSADDEGRSLHEKKVIRYGRWILAAIVRYVQNGLMRGADAMAYRFARTGFMALAEGGGVGKVLMHREILRTFLGVRRREGLNPMLSGVLGTIDDLVTSGGDDTLEPIIEYTRRCIGCRREAHWALNSILASGRRRGDSDVAAK